MASDATRLANGLLLALDREQAKQLFGARAPDALKSVVQEFVSASLDWPTERVLELDGRWRAWHELMCQPQLADEAAAGVLDHALLGGRPLSDDSTQVLRLVRPDRVPHVATVLSEITPAALETARQPTELSDTPIEEIQNLLDGLKKFYAAASAARAAVVFCATP